MKCAICGKNNFDADIFCAACGNRLRAQPTLVNAEAAMGQAAAGLPKMSVPRLVILSLITFGIYVPVWFLKLRGPLNNMQSNEKIGKGINVAAIAAGCIGLLLGFVSGVIEAGGDILTAKGIDLISAIFNLIMGIAVLNQSFAVRRILLEHFNTHLQRGIKISGVGTFCFACFYLQAKINEL
jgi:hypothetical protein